MFVPTNIISPFITWSRSLIKLIFASSNPGKTMKNHEFHKTHLASLPLINAISNQYGFLEKRFQLGNPKLCTSPCKYYSCAYMPLRRYINSQLVSLLRADASRGSQAWTHHSCAEACGQQIGHDGLPGTRAQPIQTGPGALLENC